jgi:hypothetical protein
MMSPLILKKEEKNTQCRKKPIVELIEPQDRKETA